LRDPADFAFQLVEAHRSHSEATDDEDGPLVSDPRQYTTDGAAITGVTNVTLFHLRAFLRAASAGIILA
jgi:hypothetical protein